MRAGSSLGILTIADLENLFLRCLRKCQVSDAGCDLLWKLNSTSDEAESTLTRTIPMYTNNIATSTASQLNVNKPSTGVRGVNGSPMALKRRPSYARHGLAGQLSKRGFKQLPPKPQQISHLGADLL